MILERIKAYMDYKGIKIAPFEKSIGMSNASFGKSLKNNGSIGTDKLENILSIYSDINPAWLLTGEGDMLKSSTPGTHEAPPKAKKSEKTSNAEDTAAFLSYMEKKDEVIKEKDAIIEQKNQEITALKCKVTQLEGENRHLIEEINRLKAEATPQPSSTPAPQESDVPMSHTA